MFRPVVSMLMIAMLAGCGAAPRATVAPQMGFKAASIPGLPPEVLVTPGQGAGPHPLLVIAPAKEYTMAGPLFVALAEGAAKQGFDVVRFNWGFKTRGGQPSADLAAENAELEAVMGHYGAGRKHRVLAAKSFGSRVAMRGAFKQATALMLLTPNADAKATFRQNYAPLMGYDRPLHVAMAATDPYGDVKQLYEAAPALGPELTLHVLPAGGHNFEVEGPAGPRNVAAALDGALNWLAFQR